MDDHLEKIMEQASHGSRPAAEEFFKTLLQSELYVPERFQEHPLSDMPQYPNDFLNLLGVQDGERVVVPAFSAVAHIEQWCGNQLKYQQVAMRDLLERVPQEWWLVINCGQDYSKELSPWELGQLRGGSESVAAVVDEIFWSEPVKTLDVRAPQPDEYAELQQTLCDTAAAIPAINKLYLLVEEGEDAEGQPTRQLLLGAAVSPTSTAQLEQAKDTLQVTADRCMIGAEAVKLLAGSGVESSVLLGVFRKASPFYQRQGATRPALFARLCDWLNHRRGD